MTIGNRKPIIFLAFANEQEDRNRYLRKLGKEVQQLQAILEEAERNGLCELAIGPNATIDRILDVFRRHRDRIAVFHFGGHADSYHLLLESSQSKTDLAHAGGLAAFLGQQTGLQLVFLNGCSTRRQVNDLLEAGVSSVIATSRAIDDQTATDFAIQVYRSLASGAGLRRAYLEAEAAVQIVKGGTPRHLYRAEVAMEDRFPWELYPRGLPQVTAQWSLPDTVGNPLWGLPPLPDQDLPESPFRHLRWFGREHAEVFFGRSHQIRDLYQRATAQRGAPIILFYGQSGVGKSSLLAAGLLPRLEANHEIRYVRRDQKKGMLRILKEALHPPADRGRTSQVSEAREICDPAQTWLTLEMGLDKPLLIILDQVEEVYTRPQADPSREWAECLDALETIFADPSRRPRGKLILGFRKEWLAEIKKQLETHRLYHCEVFLERLDRRGIMEAVAGPARLERLRMQYGLTVAEELPGIIADDLLQDPDSPVAPTLQILLTKMWEQAKQQNRTEPCFSLELYQELRREGLLLGDFLDQQLKALRDWRADAVDSGLALDVLVYHTTPLGTAEQRTPEEIRVVYQHQYALVDELVAQCKDLLLLVDPIQHSSLTRHGSRLAHDALAPIIRERFDRSQFPGQLARLILENWTRQWRGDEDGPSLDEWSLAMVESGKDGMRNWTVAETRIVEKSRAEVERRRGEREALRAQARAAEEAAQEKAREALANLYGIFVERAELASERRLVQEQLLYAARADLLSLDRSAHLLEHWLKSGHHFFPIRQTIRVPWIIEAIHFLPGGSLLLGTVYQTILVFDPSDGQTTTLFVGILPWLANEPTMATSILELLYSESSRLSEQLPQQLEEVRADYVDICERLQESVHFVREAETGYRDEWISHIAHIAFSLNQDLISVCDHEYRHSCALFSAHQQELVTTFKHPDWVSCSAFSPDGLSLATGGGRENKDYRIRLWAIAEDREPIAAFEMTERELAWLRAGMEMEKRHEPIATFEGHTKLVTSVSMGRDNNTIVSGSLDTLVKVWDASAAKEIVTLQGHSDEVSTVATSADGKQMASAGCDYRLRIWDASRPVVSVLSGAGRGLNYVAFSRCGQALIAQDWSDKIRIWDIPTRSEIAVLEALRGLALFKGFSDLASAPAPSVSLSERYASGSVELGPGRVVRVHDADGGHPVVEFLLRNRALAFTPDGKRMVAYTGEGEFALIDTATQQVLWRWEAPEPWGFETRVQVSPDGKLVASASPAGRIELWSLESRCHITTLFRQPPSEQESYIGTQRFSLAFSPDGKQLASARRFDRLRLFDLSTYQEIRSADEGRPEVRDVIFAPDSETLFTSHGGGTLKVWDAQTLRVLTTLQAHREYIADLALSPDGSILATASGDYTVKLWDITPLYRSPDDNYHYIERVTGLELSGLQAVLSSSPDFALSPEERTARDEFVKRFDVRWR